jgi:hypothetical protein
VLAAALDRHAGGPHAEELHQYRREGGAFVTVPSDVRVGSLPPVGTLAVR